MLVLVASIHKNSPAFCCGAETFLAAKGDGQQKDYDIFVGVGSPGSLCRPEDGLSIWSPGLRVD
jgi:hypothetical protein